MPTPAHGGCNVPAVWRSLDLLLPANDGEYDISKQRGAVGDGRAAPSLTSGIGGHGDEDGPTELCQAPGDCDRRVEGEVVFL